MRQDGCRADRATGSSISWLTTALLAVLTVAAVAESQAPVLSVNRPTPGRLIKTEITGQPNERFVLFYAHPPRIATTIAGLNGLLEIAPWKLVYYTVGGTGATSLWRKRLPLPDDPAIVGLKLELQGVAADRSPPELTNAVSLEVAAGPPTSPNIVMIMLDDSAFLTLGAYGGTLIQTPNIDAIASAGVRFDTAYAPTPICGPTRAAVLSGLQPQRFGFEFNCDPTSRSQVQGLGLDRPDTLPKLLSDAGYATGIVGKWHLGANSQFHPLHQGFDRFFGFQPGESAYFPGPGQVPIQRDFAVVQEPNYLTDAFGRESVQFIADHAQTPFFLFTSFNAPHWPLQAPSRYVARTPSIPDYYMRLHLAMMVAVDDAIGTILNELKAQGIENETLVIFTSDNGPQFGGFVYKINPFRWGKAFLYDGGTRVPLLMRWPGSIPAAKVVADTVSLVDLYPTILGAAGITPSATDGVDLVAHVNATNPPPPHPTLYWRESPTRAIRDGNWKLIQSGTSLWLYDLSVDKREQTNLATTNPTLVATLQQKLDAWEATLVAPSWPGNSPKDPTVIDGLPYTIVY